MDDTIVLTKEELALHIIEISAAEVIKRRYDNAPLADELIARRKRRISKNIGLKNMLKRMEFERIFLPFLEIIEFVEILNTRLNGKKIIRDDEFENWQTIDDCLQCIVHFV